MATNGNGQAANGTAAPSAISAGITISGNVACAGDLQISGRIEGEVRGATIFVDEGGVVEGAVEADRLRVCGTVTGTIKVGDLAVESGGVISGETSYERLKVASGGVIEGSFSPRGTAAGQAGASATGAADGESPLKLVGNPVNPRHVFVD